MRPDNPTQVESSRPSSLAHVGGSSSAKCDRRRRGRLLAVLVGVCGSSSFLAHRAKTAQVESYRLVTNALTVAESPRGGTASEDGDAPPNVGSWIPLTQQERVDYQQSEKLVCDNPFRHCCLGQGRQIFTQHQNTSQLYVKWSEPLASLSTVLEYMAEHAIPCNLWFFGMSLTGDQTIGALCELLRDGGYELDAEQCVPYENERWHEREALDCFLANNLTSGGDRPSQYYQLTNPRTASCPRVTLAHSNVYALPPPRASPLYRRGGVMIVNHGAHCKEEGCVTSRLGEIFTPRFLDMAERHRWTLMYRETERQHFDTPNGYYANYKVTRRGCRPIADANRRAKENNDRDSSSTQESGNGIATTDEDDYKNVEAQTFFQDLKLQTNRSVPIIPLAAATKPLHYMHSYDIERDAHDCTHYVYTPWRFPLTWDGMLRGLRQVQK